MNKRILWVAILCLVFALVSGPARAEKGVALHDGYHQPMNFPTGGYWPIERMAAAAERAGYKDEWKYAEDLLRDLKNKYHWNTVWGINFGTENGSKFLEIADRVGIWVLMPSSDYSSSYYWSSHASISEIAPRAKMAVEKFGKYKSLAGYVLGDEPRTLNMGFAEAWRKELKKHDPVRPCMTITTTHVTGAAAIRTGLPVICPDPYMFGYPRDPNLPSIPRRSRASYRASLEYLKKVTAGNNKRPWVMPQMFQSSWGLWYYDENQNVVAEKGSYMHWRMPTLGETRWQIWCAVANNTKGVLFYVLFPPKQARKKGEPQKKGGKVPSGVPTIKKDLASGMTRAMLYPDGTPSPQMEASSEVFKFLRKHDELFDRLEPMTPEIAYAKRPTFVNSFKDPETGDLYAVVYSDRTEEKSVADISFVLPLSEVRDMRAKKTLVVEKDTAGLFGVKVALGPGDGTLLALKPKMTQEPMEVVKEDFSLKIRQKLHNLKRIALKGQYSQGWTFAIVSAQADTYSQEAGHITYKLGHHKRIMRGFPKDSIVYVVYHGQLTRRDPESLILSASKDGEKFTWLAVGALNFPTELPRSTKAMRFEIKPGARLDGFEVISAPIVKE